MEIIVNEKRRFKSLMSCYGGHYFRCFCSGIPVGDKLYLNLCPLHWDHQPTIIHELVEGDIFRYVRNGRLSHELALWLGFDPDGEGVDFKLLGSMKEPKTRREAGGRRVARGLKRR
ncbi:MAG: hypothetical protein JRD89_18840 [Deltaproteobacteria bacterium]|nr:hypothetical protein [Deltaproteobacteria bacterium]